ncbi:MAG: hypothetical protein WCQ26_01915 [Pseudanabaena sp. ELA748]
MQTTDAPIIAIASPPVLSTPITLPDHAPFPVLEKLHPDGHYSF